MKVKLICIGKTGKSFLSEGELAYQKRLSHYVSIERIELPDLKNAAKLSIDQIKDLEGKEIYAKIIDADFVVLLDENGKHYSSVQYANFIQQKMNAGIKNLVFVIGGAYGFSSQLYQRANHQISFSSMTFSHQMIRMIFFEQTYRAMTILKNEPYHHQ